MLSLPPSPSFLPHPAPCSIFVHTRPCLTASSWKAHNARASKKREQCFATALLPSPVGRPGRLGALGLDRRWLRSPLQACILFSRCTAPQLWHTPGPSSIAPSSIVTHLQPSPSSSSDPIPCLPTHHACLPWSPCPSYHSPCPHGL
jgi:hypothetical protein